MQSINMESFSNTQWKTLSSKPLHQLIYLRDREVNLTVLDFNIVNLKLGGANNQIEFYKAPEGRE